MLGEVGNVIICAILAVFRPLQKSTEQHIWPGKTDNFLTSAHQLENEGETPIAKY
jgi:hypothetical protein